MLYLVISELMRKKVVKYSSVKRFLTLFIKNPIDPNQISVSYRDYLMVKILIWNGAPKSKHHRLNNEWKTKWSYKEYDIRCSNTHAKEIEK